jgi:glyoxylase-like metal-dependent hydrolase (beta-lactamase superfamily II)
MPHDLPLTTALGHGIVQIRLPMAGNPLRYVNGYLLEDVGEGGWTLVDCGWKADDVLEALHAGLAEVGRTLADVQRLLITHFHFDHYGLAATLLREGVPRLGMHARDWAIAQEHLADPVAGDREADEWIARNGFALEDTSIEEEVQHHRTELAVPTDLLDDGARVGRLRAVWTPGHTPGHLCFVDTISGKVLTGDHVLDPVTPHVGVWRERRGDPLGNYVASLRAVAAIPSRGALPAHGEPFADLPGRVDELLAHHDHREAQILAVLAKGATSATGVARGLVWRRRGDPFEALHPAHQQFAVAETLAHLEHLRARGLVTRDDSELPLRYALAAVVQRV